MPAQRHFLSTSTCNSIPISRHRCSRYEKLGDKRSKPNTDNRSRRSRGHEDRLLSAAFSRDGRRIVTASYDRKARARVWDAASGAQIASLPGHESAVLSAAFSPDGTRVITASYDRKARVWGAVSGAEIASLRGHGDWVLSAAFFPDGRCIVTASNDGTARVWDATSGAEIARVAVDTAVTALDLHGSSIACGDALGRVHVFDAGEFLPADTPPHG